MREKVKPFTFTKFLAKMFERKLPLKYFSSNQFRAKLFSKKLLSRNFGGKMVAVKFRNFHTVLLEVPLRFYVTSEDQKIIPGV